MSRSMVANVGSSLTAVRDVLSIAREQPAPERKRSWLRPPGALPREDEFRAACTRCTACQDACPYDSIRRLGPEFGVDGGTPAIIPGESPCYLCADMPCIAACEPGALLPVLPKEVAMGTARLDIATCYVTQGQRCDYCVTNCPLKETAIARDGGGVPTISLEGCVGCGVCSYLCPADALTITPQELNATTEKRSV